MDKTTLEKFLKNIEICINTCWKWTGGTAPDGYTYMSIRGKPHSPHRVAYEHWVGPIPDDLEIDHVCRNRECVNPNHLQIVTHQENMRRAQMFRKPSRPRALRPDIKIRCKHGHEYTPETTHITKSGTITCKTCAKISSKKSRGPTKKKTHCPHGHEYTEENTYHRKDRPGRMCKTCMRLSKT